MLAACVAGLLAAIATAQARPAPETFEDLFGAEAKRVAATSDKRDDLSFARKLFYHAGRVKDDPGFQNELYLRAFDFAVASPRGLADAERALAALGKALPNRKDEWAEKRMEIQRSKYATARAQDRKEIGLELVSRLLRVGDTKAGQGLWDQAGPLYNEALRMARAVRSPDLALAGEKVNAVAARPQAARLEAKLRDNPQDARTRQGLIEMYVTKLDDPAGAARLVTPAVGEPWRSCVPLASHGRSAALTLGRRARGYYERYLAKALGEGIEPAALARARQELNVALKQIGQAALGVPTLREDPEVR
jgi:hypothetical protein